MAFDIYAGGFARFYAREWENVAQKQARETGMRYQIIYSAQDPGPAKWDDVQAAVGHWKTALVRGLGENAPKDLNWSEDRDAPYFTDRPGWDGYSALVLMAASTATNTPLPEKLPKDSLTSDVLVRTQATAFQGAYRSITQTQLWLPGSFEFGFDFVDLCEQKVCVTSVKRLHADLLALKDANGITNEQSQTIMREGYEDGADFIRIAVFGLTVFERIAQEAERHSLPVFLSY